MAHNVYSLSPYQPRIVILPGEEDGGRSVRSRGTAAGVTEDPVIVTRPADDDAASAGRRAGMAMTSAVMFTQSTNVVNQGQRVTITFDSEVAGTCYVSFFAYPQFEPPYWTAGSFTSENGNTAQARSTRVSLNAVSGNGFNVMGPAHGQVSDPNEFRWFAVGSSVSATTPTAFPVVQGSNTLVIDQSNANHGEGMVLGAVEISLEQGNGIPSGPLYMGPQLLRNTEPYGQSHYNSKGVTDILERAKTGQVTILCCGSSLTVRDYNWARYWRDRIAEVYGYAGSIQRGATDGDVNLGQDLNSVAEEGWSDDVTKHFTTSSANGGASYNTTAWGDRGHQWADGETGSLVLNTPADATGARIVYRTYASGSTLTISDDGTQVASVDTTGSDSRFDGVTVPVTGGTQLTIAKSTSSGAAAVAAVIHYTNANGVVVGRLCWSGNSQADVIAPRADALASYINACEVDLVFWDSANEQPVNNNSEGRNFLPDYQATLQALTPVNGALALVDLFGFTDATISGDPDHWNELTPSPMVDWTEQRKALIATDYWTGLKPAIFSGFWQLGGWEAWPALHNAGGFAAQSDNPRQVTDSHTSQVGGRIVGDAIAQAVLDAVAANAGTTLSAAAIASETLAAIKGDAQVGSPALAADVATIGSNVTAVLNKFFGITSLAGWLRLLARRDAGVAADEAGSLSEINADGGAGAGSYSPTFHAQQAVRENLELAWSAYIDGNDLVIRLHLSDFRLVSGSAVSPSSTGQGHVSVTPFGGATTTVAYTNDATIVTFAGLASAYTTTGFAVRISSGSYYAQGIHVPNTISDEAAVRLLPTQGVGVSDFVVAARDGTGLYAVVFRDGLDDVDSAVWDPAGPAWVAVAAGALPRTLVQTKIGHASDGLFGGAISDASDLAGYRLTVAVFKEEVAGYDRLLTAAAGQYVPGKGFQYAENASLREVRTLMEDVRGIRLAVTDSQTASYIKVSHPAGVQPEAFADAVIKSVDPTRVAQYSRITSSSAAVETDQRWLTLSPALPAQPQNGDEFVLGVRYQSS